ncbi:hypothetical protein ACLB2K_047984 [Fragaria x ananassa]
MSRYGSALGKILMTKRTRAGHLAWLPCKVISLGFPAKSTRLASMRSHFSSLPCEVNSLPFHARSSRFASWRSQLASLPCEVISLRFPAKSTRFASILGLYPLLMDLNELPLGW